jgi:hypothetical protein
MPKNANIFICEACDFKCSKQSNYNKHLLTAKHRNTTKLQQQHVCECGKTFSYRGSLWNHKNKHCQYNVKNANQDSLDKVETKEASETTEITTLRTLVSMQQEQITQQKQSTEQFKDIISQQTELYQQQLKEQQEQHNKQIQDLIPKLQQVTNINNTNSNNTTNNNKFNLNFFLNEQCKDAISIQTFIENLDIGIKELEHMGNVGYLQGMMTIMSNTLGAMDVYKRPVHCTDLKRETVYIKDGDTWKKDNANNDDLRRVINTVANVNYRNLDVWESQHPDAFESDTPDNIEYCKIAMESMGGYDNSDDKIAIKLNKLVKHVVREVYVK